MQSNRDISNDTYHHSLMKLALHVTTEQDICISNKFGNPKICVPQVQWLNSVTLKTMRSFERHRGKAHTYIGSQFRVDNEIHNEAK
jgi:hypothetical protein